MKRRLSALLLALILCLTLLPAASAAGTELSEVPDVFQGDGVYVTAKEFPIPEGWTVYNGVPQGVHEGFITLIRQENVQDENGFYTGTRTVMNWMDEDGRLFDFSDWDTPPTLGRDGNYYYTFHDGLCHYYDSEVGGYGYIDTEGNKVIEPVAGRYGTIHFCSGLLLIGNGQAFVDKTGKTVFSLEELGWDGKITTEYSDGLFGYQGYLDADRNTYFSGWLNLEGEPVITLYSGSESGYSTQNVPYPSATFSEGYAFYTDSSGGRSYPAYVFIDTQGNRILTLEPKAPVYIGSIGGGERYLNSDPGKIRGGRFWVNYADTTPEIEYQKKNYAVLMDLEGRELYRDNGWEMMAGFFDNGVALDRGGIEGLFIDIHGKTVVPQFTVEKNGTTIGSFKATTGFNEDDQTLGCLGGMNGVPDTYYLLEVHQGTYTGSGKVYNAATGQMTDGGTANPDPEPAGDQPSSWAAEQVNRAVSAGLVPEDLRSQYTRTATRAEFCALAVELYETVKGTEITERASFSDTGDVNVEKMAGLGVVGGIGGGRFSPGGELNREQAATILARLSEALGQPLAAGETAFADSGSISDWAREAVGQMKAAGIMDGTGNNNFSPLQPYTREQCILTVLRLFENLK